MNDTPRNRKRADTCHLFFLDVYFIFGHLETKPNKNYNRVVERLPPKILPVRITSIIYTVYIYV